MRSRSGPDSVRIAGMTDLGGRSGLERLLRPRSVAIVGISKEPGSLGETQVDVAGALRPPIHVTALCER